MLNALYPNTRLANPIPAAVPTAMITIKSKIVRRPEPVNFTFVSFMMMLF